MAKVPEAEDQLTYVRARLADVPSDQYEEIAKVAGVTWRTLYLIRKESSNPLYGTVNAIYKYLKENEPPKKRAAKVEVKS